MKKTIFTITLIACIMTMGMNYASADETYFNNDEDMIITEFQVEENSDNEVSPETDQELMDLDDLLMTISNADFSRCWDMTDTTYVETGGIAIGNTSKNEAKNSIYAIKVTTGNKTNAKLYTSGINSTSSNQHEIKDNLGHTNDMTYGYDPKTKNHVLFVVPLYSTNVYKISAATCTLQETYTTYDKQTYNRGAIAYTGSQSGANYITRTKDTTEYHFEKIQGTQFCEKKSFNVEFQNTDVSDTIMQGICVYNNYLYIAVKKKNSNNLIYKVETRVDNILDNSTVTAKKQYNLGTTTTVYNNSSKPFEIESIDMVNGICYFTANINAGSNDSGLGDFTGKFSM